MKNLIFILVVIGLAALGHSQSIEFKNIGTDAVNAQSINAPITNHNGLLLAGADFSVQLYYAPSSNPSSTESAEFINSGMPVVNFFTGGVAGYFFSSQAVVLTGYAQGQVANVQVRAWDNRTGSTWELASARGASPVFATPSLGNPLNPATIPLLRGLTSFGLVNGAFPEIAVLGNANLITNGSTNIAVTNLTDFGPLDIAGATRTNTFVITNSGTTNLTIAQIFISGTGSDDFSLITAPSSNIAAGTSSPFQTKFDPSQTGSRTASISFGYNFIGGTNITPYTFDIGGLGNTNAGSPEIAVLGNNQLIVSGSTNISVSDFTDFGPLNRLGAASTNTFVVTNSGSTSLIINLPIVFSGPASNDFAIVSSPASNIAAGASSPFQIKFDPTAAGPRSATLVLGNSDTNENPYTFVLGGAGTNSLNPVIGILGNDNLIANGSTNTSSTNFTYFGSLNVASTAITIGVQVRVS